MPANLLDLLATRVTLMSLLKMVMPVCRCRYGDVVEGDKKNGKKKRMDRKIVKALKTTKNKKYHLIGRRIRV